VGDDHAFNLVSIFADTSCQAGRCSPRAYLRQEKPAGIQDDNFIVVLENAGILPISYKPPGNNFDGGVGFVVGHCVLRLFFVVKI